MAFLMSKSYLFLPRDSNIVLRKNNLLLLAETLIEKHVKRFVFIFFNTTSKNFLWGI